MSIQKSCVSLQRRKPLEYLYFYVYTRHFKSPFVLDALRNLLCKRVRVDEIWAFVGMKQKNVPAEHKGELGYGDIWTWVALDAEPKLVPS